MSDFFHICIAVAALSLTCLAFLSAYAPYKVFVFQLNKEEWDSLRFQIGFLDVGRGQYTKFLPHAFTEQGLAMLSGVLNSDIAINVNISIMRAFVSLRQVAAIVRQSDLLGLKKDILAYIDDILADQNDINESTRTSQGV